MMPYRRRYSGKFAPEITPEKRAAIVAAVASGKKYVEVAEQFNVSIGTISKFVNANKRAVRGPENALARLRSLQRPSSQPPLTVSHRSTAPLSKEYYEEPANPYRQKYWRQDELGYGYLVEAPTHPVTAAPAPSTALTEEERIADDRRRLQDYRAQFVWRIYGDL